MFKEIAEKTNPCKACGHRPLFTGQYCSLFNKQEYACLCIMCHKEGEGGDAHYGDTIDQMIASWNTANPRRRE